jgi:hypothetical protein
MKKLTFVFVLSFAASTFAQQTFELKNASRFFDIKFEVATCDSDSCTGGASFSFYKKGSATPYQVIKLSDTYVQLEDGAPMANVTMLYDKQSVVNVDDFNFDGMEDVAICDGTNGSYSGPSYGIYLASRSARKFVFSQSFTDLAYHLGMFTVNKKGKTLETFDKSGCCLHETARYSVIGNRPVKIFSELEDATIQDETKVRITTKVRINGKWKTTVKYVKRQQ